MKHFLSCDWGTSSFRLRLVSAGDKKIVDEFHSDQGIAKTHKDWLTSNLNSAERITFYLKVLKGGLHELSKTSIDKNIPLIISGMASSSIGMKELPYTNFPVDLRTPEQLNIHFIESGHEFSHPVFLVSGCRTDRDIMRGEETILLGSDVIETEHALYILPGTHSKHIVTDNGIATDFRTFVTGELFNLLVENSILANSVQKGNDPESFSAGVRASQTENILNSIFSIRARHIIDHTSLAKNYQYLSGLIIGLELGDIKKTSHSIYLVSEASLMWAYEVALKEIGVGARLACMNATTSLINAHHKIFEHLKINSFRRYG
jgi:2-dehydro-3-deoxygalactonokinase